jgi:CRISPR system Cascade subunit CasA
MPEELYNLLREPLITVIPYGGCAEARSLPEILAALSRDELFEFAVLQPYQSHAWHAFLVQLAAIALYQYGADLSSMRDPTQWQETIRRASGGNESPWTLVVPNLTAAAFMQPPVPEGSLADWEDEYSPAEVDILQTAKNHDVKKGRISQPRPEHWIFALVALQTMQGYSGRKNYGIARMYGGYSNRPCFATYRDLSWATRFRRDVSLLIENRSEIASEDDFNAEICRRVRLLYQDGRVVARRTTSKTQRIAAKELKGNLGDPWVPVKVNDGAALTARRLDYDLVRKILFGGDFRPSRASIPRPVDGNEPLFIGQLLAADQGTTEGYYERLIPLSLKTPLRLATKQGRQKLGELSQRRCVEIQKVRKALLSALTALLEGGADKSDSVRLFDDEVDRIFFAELFADLDLDFDEARRKWLRQLLKIASKTLDAAKNSLPVPSARLFRARAAADRVFDSRAFRLRKAAGDLPAEGEKDGRTSR